MCCTMAFSSRRNKQSHLLAPSLASQFHSTEEVRLQEKGQIFQEVIQASGRAGASGRAVSSRGETAGTAGSSRQRCALRGAGMASGPNPETQAQVELHVPPCSGITAPEACKSD